MRTRGRSSPDDLSVRFKRVMVVLLALTVLLRPVAAADPTGRIGATASEPGAPLVAVVSPGMDALRGNTATVDQAGGAVRFDQAGAPRVSRARVREHITVQPTLPRRHASRPASQGPPPAA